VGFIGMAFPPFSYWSWVSKKGSMKDFLADYTLAIMWHEDSGIER
jgi:hypothetical protein